MFAIPHQTAKDKIRGEYKLAIILEEENLDRMKHYDPGDLTLSKLTPAFASLKLTQIILLYVSPPETDAILNMAMAGKGPEALALLSRGWEWKPEAGDHAGPYEKLGGSV